MEFYIRKNATLPYLKVLVHKDGRNQFNQFANDISGSTITFSMYDEETGVYKILDRPASIMSNGYINPEYYVYYDFRKTDTKKEGRFIGEFKIINSQGTIILPVRETLYINVLSSFADSDTCCRPNRGEPSIIFPTQTPKNTVTPTISNSQTPTPTATANVTVTPTGTPTNTPTNTPTQTPTGTPTNTPTQTPTGTANVTTTPTITPTNTPTVTPTCGTFTQQYLRVRLLGCTNFDLTLFDDPSFTINANAVCDYVVSGCAYGDLGTIYCGTETMSSGNHVHTFNLSPVLQPGECITGFTVSNVTPQCPCVNVSYIEVSPTPTPTNTPSITPTNTPTNTPTGTANVTSTPTNTVTPTTTSTPEASPLVTQTVTPTNTVTPTFTPTPTITPTNTVTPTHTPTVTPSPTQAIAPADPSLQIYYDASIDTNFDPVPVSGDTFNQWNDSSASAHNATPIGGGSKPEWWSNVQCGLSAVKFDGTTSKLSVNPLTAIANITGYTAIVMGKILNTGTTQQFVTSGIGNASTNNSNLRLSGGTFVIGAAGGTAQTAQIADLNPHMWTMVFDGTQSTNADKLKFYIDGTQESLTFLSNVGTSTNSSIDTLYIGVDRVGVSTFQYYYSGFMYEVLLWTRVLSASELNAVHNYLDNKWLYCIPPTPTPTNTPTSTVTPTPTNTVTPTISLTPTNTPTPSSTPIPVTGYGFNLVALPYSVPSSGNTIISDNNGTQSQGSTNPNSFSGNTVVDGIYWNAIDTDGIDRTSYFSGFTGQSVTLTISQTGSTAIYSGNTGTSTGIGYTFGTWTNPPDTGFYFRDGGTSNPDVDVVLVQSATTQWVTGTVVYISAVIN